MTKNIRFIISLPQCVLKGEETTKRSAGRHIWFIKATLSIMKSPGLLRIPANM